MLPDPLHPAVVHFPLVLAFVLPISALVALWAIRRGTSRVRAWAVPLVVAVALFGSAWVALETGESQEDTVERVVPENALHAHEEAAERFLLLGGIVGLVAAAGLLGGTVGTAARVLATGGSFVLILAAVQVGAAGGELVYEHNAASAYVQPAARSASEARPAASRSDPTRATEERERDGG